MIEVLGIAALGVLALHVFPQQWVSVLVAAALIGLAWQQSGWLAHDFLHHQVFHNRTLNDMVGLFIGNMFQGFSVDWWKNKHNTHHAIPNLHESADDRHDGDPDIDTLPFLAWSKTMTDKARRDPSGWSAFFVRHQKYLFFPLLSFARLIWAQQSVVYAVADLIPEGMRSGAWGGGRVSKQLRYPIAEPLGLLVHYSAIGYLMWAYMTPLQAVAFFLGAQMFCGILLAVSFVVGHNGMECFDYDKVPGYAELQIRTTRNVTDDALGLSGWFTGGLHLQVEHHLFPTMPRHHLHKTRPFVEEVCRKHKLHYHSKTLFAGLGEVLSCLDEMAEPLIKAVSEFPAM
jgi:acyl-lipid Delta6-acetylenase / acyl-lipid (9-3)-desaturase